MRLVKRILDAVCLAFVQWYIHRKQEDGAKKLRFILSELRKNRSAAISREVSEYLAMNGVRINERV